MAEEYVEYIYTVYIQLHTGGTKIHGQYKMPSRFQADIFSQESSSHEKEYIGTVFAQTKKGLRKKIGSKLHLALRTSVALPTNGTMTLTSRNFVNYYHVVY